jgi:type IV pilus assembly protein PilY1
MSPTQRPHNRLKRCVAHALVLAMLTPQWATVAYGAATPLADVPIAAKVTAKPNIVYTVDDSGSMSNYFLPDFVVLNYCKGGGGTTACSTARNNPGAGGNFFDPPFWASDFNHLAYNPNVTYSPPLKADGLPLTYSIGTVTDNAGNQNAAGTMQKIQADPYLAPATLHNLSGNVAVPLYCNSDWPLDTTIGANGQYDATKGRDCRINGTKYDALGPSPNSPAVAGDYHYPWQYNAAPGKDSTQYYFSQGSPKALWCDKNAAGWPTVSCATYCPAGVPTKTSIPQTWTPTGNVNTCCTGAGAPVAGCTAASTYSPASCNTSTIYCSPGLGKPGECTSGCSCNTQITGRNGTCSYVDPTSGVTITTGSLACSGSGCTATCPNVNVVTGCTIGSPSSECAAATGYCNAFIKGSATTTLLDDANLVNGGTGTVCRHNNQAYGAEPANPLTYNTAALGGLAPWNTKVTGTASAGTPNPPLKWGFRAGQACPAVPSTVSIPRHYYVVDSVQFCNGTIGTNNDKWKGFGTGTCQDKNDLTTYRNVQYGSFKRVDLIAAQAPFSYTDPVTGAAMTRTLAQEQQNYANWYAYYRTRILATKTTSAIAFSYLDDTYRVGFQNLGSEMPPNGVGAAIKWVDVGDFTGTALGTTRGDWYNTLFNIAITTYTTPIMNGMLRVGNLFETGGAGGLPASVTPLPAGAKDPITVSCQSNYHILFTDGFTNQAALPTVAGNKDLTIPAWTGITQVPPDQVLTTLPSGSNWPKPFIETAPAMSDTLADIAAYYWARDLRSGMKNDVPAPSGKGGADADPTKDVAWWQHVNFNALSFGSEGVLDANDQTTTIGAIKAGTQAWPRTTPNPNQPTNPPGNPGATAVDDLWHATVMGRGRFVYARSPIEVSYGLANILAGIQNQRKSRVGAAFNGQVLDSTNNIIYQATIEPGWSGDLLKVQIDPATGDEVTTVWQAGPVLNTMLTPTLPTDEPWFTARKVVTVDKATGKGVPFTYATLHVDQRKSLSSDPVQQQKIIAYLRGADHFNAGAQTIEGVQIGQFRLRSGKLGDISNAQAVVVGPPTRPYLDINDKFYSTFKTAQAARPERVFAAANDGMLHAFDTADGKEVYAFIPGALFRGDAASVTTQDVTGIQSLTYQDGGVPIFRHRFFVDSSPRVADVDFGNGTGDWHTILVGGLGKGGNTYYALDITSASAADESVAAAKVLWEWRNPDNDDYVDPVTGMHRLQTWPGYTYGRPVIVKTKAFGWTVLVTSGYNNKSGLGKLYFLNPQTGALMHTMTTTAGSPGDPSGLAQIHAFVKDFRNQVAEQVYGGDLMGNLWRFDISGATTASWTVDLLAKLVDDASPAQPQPITTAPQIEIDLNNGVDRYVMIGTGRLLDTSDLTTPSPPQRQTMYAIRDGTLDSVKPSSDLPIDTSRATTPLKPISADGISSIAGGAPDGWYHDLPNADPATAERIVVDVAADVNVAAYIGTQAPNDPCIISLPASLYARDYTTARSLLESGGTTVASILWSSGAVGGTLVGRVNPVTGEQSLGWLLSKEVPGSEPVDIQNPVKGPGNRLTWRLLTGQQ